MIKFFKRLRKVEKLSELEPVCHFFIQHTLKVMDPSYLKGKKSLSKFDKEVMMANKKWGLNELNAFSDLLYRLLKLSRTGKKSPQ